MANFRVHARHVLHYQDAQVRRIIGAPDGMVGHRLGRLADEVANAARRRAPHDTGRLAGSIRARVGGRGGSLQGVVEATAPHARWVHDGTGIYGPRHRAIQSRGRLMAWRGNGEDVFARRVRGMPPNPFLKDAAEAVIGLRAI